MGRQGRRDRPVTTTVPSDSRIRMAPVVAGVALLVWAALIALAPTLDGDNYCGRLYFDTQRNAACQDTMAMRGVRFLVLAGLGVVPLAWVLVATRRPSVIVAGMLGAVAVAGVLVGFNRLLQPTPPTVFCGSVLNRHGPYEGAREARCEAIHSSMKRAATLAFGVSALSTIGAGAILRAQRGRDPWATSNGAAGRKPRRP